MRTHNAPENQKKFKKSLLAVYIMAFAVPAIAQDVAEESKEDDITEIIITETRVNLENAQTIKRTADTFVDAISAEDMGSLPDRSVLEAMQRIPGISIERFAAANDPDHFGVEGSGAVIRGMSATRSEFNGRDSFTANSGRGLSFQDVPPELMSGVEVFKNQTADMVEGGIGGTVNLKTRKPFDKNERVMGFNVDYSYGDMAKEWTPTFSGLFSDVLETDSAGRFGFLVNVANSELKGVSHGIQSDAYVEYKDDYTNFTKTLQSPDSLSAHAGPSDIPGAERFAGQTVWMPNGSNLTMKNDDRSRKGYATSLQWESPDETFLATFQFMRSDARLTWKENALKYQSGYGSRQSLPLDGTEFTFDDRGLFQAGTITQDAAFTRAWRGSNPTEYGVFGDDSYVAPFYMPGFDGITNEQFNTFYEASTPEARELALTAIGAKGASQDALDQLSAATTKEERAAAMRAIQAGSQTVGSLQQFGYRFQSDNRIKDTRTVIDDFGLNFKWNPSDNLELSLDLQHIAADTSDNDVLVSMATHAAQAFDTRGSTPHLTLIEPWHGARDNNPGLYGVAGAGTPIHINAKQNDPTGANAGFKTPADFPDEADPVKAAADANADLRVFNGYSNDPQGDKNWFQDPSSYNWQSILDHFERSDGDSDAGRFDVKYSLDDSFITKVSGGVRYANRLQNVRFTNYGTQWGALSPLWGTPPGYADAPYVDPQNPTAPISADLSAQLDKLKAIRGSTECVDWSNFHGGGVLDMPGGCALAPNDALVKAATRGDLSVFPITAVDGTWVPASQREGVLPGNGGLFLPSEVFVTEETNQAAYVRVDFGSDETRFKFSGNVGLRYVDFERSADGSVQFSDAGVVTTPAPEGAPDARDLAALQAWMLQKRSDWIAAKNATTATQIDPEVALSGRNKTAFTTYMRDLLRYANDPANVMPADDVAYNNGAVVFQESIYNFDDVLPSFNLKVEFTDELIGRFAVSKALALPDMEDVKNTTTIGASVDRAQITYATTTGPYNDFSGLSHLIGVDPSSDLATAIDPNNGYSGGAGNPKLGPMESIQYDMSLEWYFAKAGSLTTSIFYKDLSNFFIQGSFPKEVTNNGVTHTVFVDGTVNNGKGSIQGIEVAYQQFFDMLPAPWDGLGIQANYSYIDSKSVPNQGELGLDPNAGDNDSPDSAYTGANVDLNGLPLKGQSKKTANFAVMYEKNEWSARLAYNWRSRYLLTTRDVISRYPMWNDDAGFLDGSVFYKFDNGLTTGIQLTNILDTQTKTIMILDGKGLEAGRSWFVNDRRVSVVLKGSF
ncbi:MAG: TonB-dependent receptor [Gammaproteobacteria bacterium]|nr:MAG: TonB-dependent receptor [Gammaproteobacteria bacterium]